jgi:hypothetical protein
MLISLQGVYREGRIDLLETPPALEQARVIVTFLPDPREVDLASYGIDPAHAADLRARLTSFAEDWDAPEMDVYDTRDQDEIST